MNNESIKIKYLIGSFRDDPEYPSVEDFEFLIGNWFFNEGGKQFVHDNRGVEETGKICFTNNILQEKLNGDEKATKSLLDSLLSSGKIQVIKETRFTTYYTVV
jgi:hypothetical protein